MPQNVDRFDSYKNFFIRPDDIFILGYPRSGTTRLQELIWIIANDFDFKTLMEYDCGTRIPFFESPELSFELREKPLVTSFEEMSSPRTIKSHLPVQFLPDEIWTKKPKLIHISRDPKDAIISLFYLLNDFSPVPIKLEDFLEDFLSDNVMYCPYREYVWNFLNLPDYENILYLTYEEMSADLDGTIQKVGKFLGKTVSEENASKIKDYLNFEKMKNRKTNDNKFAYKKMMQIMHPNLNNDVTFIRKGVIGGYRSDMPKEYADRIDYWYAESGNLNQGYNYKNYAAIKKIFGS
ncbi:hypothetical protein ACKWTF_011361 [Chironomus riparius]